MNKYVQILILLALFPTVGNAREETLEERKQRIVRKYLRERSSITQSDMVVPSDLPEEEDIKDSEKFLEPQVDIARQDTTASPMLPPPPRPIPVPRANNSNWLLDNTDEMDGVSDGSDPYAVQSPFDTDSDSWSAWDDTGGKGDPVRTRESYDPRADPYARERSTTSRLLGGAAQQEYSSRGMQQGTGIRESSTYTRSGILGGQPDESVNTSGFNLQDDRSGRYGSGISEGMLASPYRQMNEATSRKENSTGTEQQRLQGYQPYKSPYQQEQEQRTQQWGNQTQQQQFERDDSYQQWKERNQTWDPTQDDAYINQYMQPKRR